jgi:uncharacterized protein YjbI with pentapeptide repeats
MRSVRTSFSLLAVVVVALAALAGCDPAARRLAGEVLDGGTTPVVGVTVEVFADDAETLVAQTVTAAGGRFRLDEGVVADGVDYRIRANGDTWYGGTDWASATSVTAGDDTDITIDIAFDPATISGTFDYSYEGVVRLHNAAGGAIQERELLSDSGAAFEFTDVAPGTYRLEYRNRYFPSGVITNHTAWFEVAAGAEVVRNDPFPAVSSRTIWGTDGSYEVPGDQSLGRWILVDAANGDVISEAQWRMAGDREVRYFADRETRVLAIATSNLYRTQYLGATAANPQGTVFGPSNPISALERFELTGRDCDPAVFQPGMDLRTTDLSGKILINCDLRDVDLTGVVLPATVNVNHVDLSGAELAGADLSGAHLGAMGFEGTNATGADLSGALMNGAAGTGGIFDDADLSQAFSIFSTFDGASFRGANLTGLFFDQGWSQNTDFTGANLGTAYVSSTNLSGSDFTDADLRGATLSVVNLTGADLSGANLQGATLSSVTGLATATYDNTTCPNGSVVTSPAVCTP